MTTPLSRGRTTPAETSVSDLKSRMMDTLDDARAGHATIIMRNGRPIAGLVPVEVARAYMANTDLAAQIRTEIAAAIGAARGDINGVLDRLTQAVIGDQGISAGLAEYDAAARLEDGPPAGVRPDVVEPRGAEGAQVGS